MRAAASSATSVVTCRAREGRYLKCLPVQFRDDGKASGLLFDAVAEMTGLVAVVRDTRGPDRCRRGVASAKRQGQLQEVITLKTAALT
jgi:NADPH:quinone reductase-like Zn-dependent oxidoreductase